MGSNRKRTEVAAKLAATSTGRHGRKSSPITTARNEARRSARRELLASPEVRHKRRLSIIESALASVNRCQHNSLMVDLFINRPLNKLRRSVLREDSRRMKAEGAA